MAAIKVFQKVKMNLQYSSKEEQVQLLRNLAKVIIRYLKSLNRNMFHNF